MSSTTKQQLRMNAESEIYVIASGEVISTGAASSLPVGFPSVAEPPVELLLHVTFASLLVLCLERVNFLKLSVFKLCASVRESR